MKEAVLITGFNNWGKTTLIQNLFGNQTRFWQGYLYIMSGVAFANQFTVETHSNDDYWGQDWINKIEARINNSPDNGQYLCTALCPTLHNNNNFIDLLQQPVFAAYAKLHIFLIEYKWEHHAKLLIPNIISSGLIDNTNFITINADQNETNDDTRWNLKTNQIRDELNQIF